MWLQNDCNLYTMLGRDLCRLCDTRRNDLFIVSNTSTFNSNFFSCGFWVYKPLQRGTVVSNVAAKDFTRAPNLYRFPHHYSTSHVKKDPSAQCRSTKRSSWLSIQLLPSTRPSTAKYEVQRPSAYSTLITPVSISQHRKNARSNAI